MRVLVTNDDGVDAPGLAVLASRLKAAGLDVVVVAPLREASGAGAGIGPLHTMGAGVAVSAVEREGLEGVETFGVDALPALIVIAACMGAYGPAPDMIVSGINAGRNVGRAVLHSGTIGAALTAVHFNKRGLAVSIQTGRFAAFEATQGSVPNYDTAAELAAELAPRLASTPPGTVVSCNVPNLPMSALRGLCFAKLARSGLIRSALLDKEGGMRMQLELGFGDPPTDEETDEALTGAGFATITPLSSVSEETHPDVRRAVASALADTGATLGLKGRNGETLGGESQ